MQEEPAGLFERNKRRIPQLDPLPGAANCTIKGVKNSLPIGDDRKA